jgi:hypothetical protein
MSRKTAVGVATAQGAGRSGCRDGAGRPVPRPPLDTEPLTMPSGCVSSHFALRKAKSVNCSLMTMSGPVCLVNCVETRAAISPWHRFWTQFRAALPKFLTPRDKVAESEHARRLLTELANFRPHGVDGATACRQRFLGISCPVLSPGNTTSSCIESASVVFACASRRHRNGAKFPGAAAKANGHG